MSNLKIKIEAILSRVPCGSNVSYSGGVSYPTEKIIQLGSNSGDVRINFQAYGVPDRLVAFLDNIQVLDTGYIGSPSHQTDLNSWLNQNNEQPQTITNNFNSIIQYYITKTSTNPQNLILKIYAPLSGTAWDVFVDCPKPTNHLPIPNDFTIKGNPSSQYIFTASDFLNHYSDLDGDTLKGIIIIDAGNGFSYNNNSTYNGRIIPLQDIIDGKLKYNFPSTPSTSQIAKWRAVDINDGITNINNMATITMINNALANSCATPIGGNYNYALYDDRGFWHEFAMVVPPFYALEYEVATDNNFTTIIKTGILNTIGTVLGSYENLEEDSAHPGNYILRVLNFDCTAYPNLYTRIRKWCTVNEKSDWYYPIRYVNPNFGGSGNTGVGIAPYQMNPVVIIPSKISDPTISNSYGYNICSTDNAGTCNLKMNTATPQIGTQLYLNDGITKAKTGNIPSDLCGIGSDLNVYGISFIRFTTSDVNVTKKIYTVDPTTGIITGIYGRSCP